jgi:transitional endoplasmic reticulum ATPase
MDRKPQLTPAQKMTAERLLAAIPASSVLVLRCGSGMGRTTILRSIHDTSRGAFVGMKQFMDLLTARQPLAIEESFVDLIDNALEDHDLVIVDDLHLLRDVVEGCDYPRPWMLAAALTAVMDEAGARGKKMLFAVDTGIVPIPISRRAQSWQVADFAPEDYAQVCCEYLPGQPGQSSSHLDFARIHRFAPMLNIWQLKNACLSLQRDAALDTEDFVGYLNEHNMSSNVEIEEVRPVDLKDLKGLDDVVRALEVKIALPFENHVLAAELNLRPRRGVLLAGPPGTGKTTIGRALARRLKGKFFLIDGTAIAGSSDFCETVRKVFDAATKNAPSVIFIDDTDVIFEGKEDRGLYRYLLTKLDGLESASADRVCVMMTAMDPGSLPPALLRSGRIELWLETRLPDVEARAAILSESLLKLPPPICATDICVLASASQGLTGADLKSVIEDGKLLFAHDKATDKPLRPVEQYFLEAIETVRANRRNYGKRKAGPFGEDTKIGFGAA